DPDKLLEFNIALPDVEAAIKANNLNKSGGFQEEGLTERPVRVIGRLGPEPEKGLDDIRKIPLKVNSDRTVLLQNVAAVEEGPAPKRGDAGVDGRVGVVITVVKQPHTDTRKVTEDVKAALRELEASLPADIVINTDLFQLRTFIDRGIYY